MRGENGENIAFFFPLVERFKKADSRRYFRKNIKQKNLGKPYACPEF